MLAFLCEKWGFSFYAIDSTTPDAAWLRFRSKLRPLVTLFGIPRRRMIVGTPDGLHHV
jgi:hypothetical protein